MEKEKQMNIGMAPDDTIKMSSAGSSPMLHQQEGGVEGEDPSWTLNNTYHITITIPNFKDNGDEIAVNVNPYEVAPNAGNVLAEVRCCQELWHMYILVHCV